MKRYIALIILLIRLVIPPTALAQGRGDPLVIPSGQHYSGDVSTVSQDIQVDGAVNGDVTTWGGDVMIAGHVSGDVVSYTGEVKIAASGRVDGHVLALGGGLQQEPGALVAGQMLQGGSGASALASVVDILSPPSDSTPRDTAFGRALFGATLGVLLLAFCLLSMAFWPRRIAAASTTLMRIPGRTLALGLITTLALAIGLLPLVALLAATLIGMPLIVLVVLLAQAPYIYGLAALARAIGARMSGRAVQALEFDWATARSALALVLLIALVGALAPWWGLALFYLIASPGLGAAILSRGGMLVPVPARG